MNTSLRQVKPILNIIQQRNCAICVQARKDLNKVKIIRSEDSQSQYDNIKIGVEESLNKDYKPPTSIKSAPLRPTDPQDPTTINF